MTSSTSARNARRLSPARRTSIVPDATWPGLARISTSDGKTVKLARAAVAGSASAASEIAATQSLRFSSAPFRQEPRLSSTP